MQRILFFFTMLFNSAPLLAGNDFLAHESLSLVPFVLLAVIILVSILTNKTPEKPLVEKSEEDLFLMKQAYNLLKFSDLATAAVDVNMKLVFCNVKFASHIGLGPDELVGKSILRNNPFPATSSFNKTLSRIYLERKIPDKPIIVGVNLQSSESNELALDYMAMLRPFKEGNQDLILIVVVFSRDADMLLDDLLKSIEKKDSDLRKMEEIDQLKSEFLATLSHELKTPLVSIKGYMDLMESEKFGPLTEGQKKALRISLRNTSHLNTLISSILNFARMEAGKLKFDLSQQKIAPLISETIDSMKPIADKNKIEIVAEIEPDLPGVIMDAELIHRVILNLIDNSIKFSEPDTAVLVKAENFSDNLVKISVIDQGHGIPQDKLEKIKAPFYQADKSDTRPKGGLGLGLAICEKILVGHGSFLKIESELDKGSKISFLLKSGSSKKVSERIL